MRIINNINNLIMNAGVLGVSVNPVDREGTAVLSLGGPKWVEYLFGTLFILLGIALILFYPKAKKNADKYKQNQLEEWKKLHPKRQNAKYTDTDMFLPAWPKAKLFAPVFFAMVFIIIGIAWIVGNTLGTL